MIISELILKLNGDSKAIEVAKELGVSGSTLARRLKAVGYSYNNKSKVYEYVGVESEKEIIDNKLTSELLAFKINNKNDSNQKKIIYKSEIKKENIKEESEINLTEDEIKFLKRLHSRQVSASSIDLGIEFALLPTKKETKKHSIDISKIIWDDFDDFSNEMQKEKRLTKNDLIEIALVQFMKKYR